MQAVELKQKYLRDTLLADEYEDFSEFFMNETGDQTCSLDRLTYEEVKRIVDKFKAVKAQQQKEQKHQRSFAIYQTADLQQAYSIVSAVQNSQNNTQPKPGQRSASDLLDSVFQASSTNINSPDKNSPPHQNYSPPVQTNNIENKYQSNSHISAFQKGNIWATTTNVQGQRKPAQFDNFWQFPTSTNVNKAQQFKTEVGHYNNNGGFQSSNLNNKRASLQQNVFSGKNQTKNQQQHVPSYEQLTKTLNMGKKPNTFVTVEAEKPSNMKKAQNLPNIAQQYTSNPQPNKQANLQMRTNSKQIKLISQKPLSKQHSSSYLGTSTNLNNNPSFQPQFSSVKPAISSASAYKMNKIPYKGPTVHKSQFRDTIKCIQAQTRPHLNDPKLQVKIQKHEVIAKTFFMSDYVMYSVTIKPKGTIIQRNYEDFSKLRMALERFYPGVQLPYLEKNSWFQTNQENVKTQKVMLEFFTNDLIKNPEIRNSRIFQDFLTLSDHKKIKRKFEEYAKMDAWKGLQELCISGGEVEVIVNQNQRIYHDNLGRFVQSMEDLLGRKTKLVEVLGTQFQQVQDTLINLKKLSATIAEQVKKFNQSVSDYQIPSLESTFNIISKSFDEWANRISFESKVVLKRLVPFYKYEKDNLTTIKSVLQTQGSLYRSYIKRSASESSATNETYTSSSLKSFKTGVLQQSRNMTILKYQLGYMSNMLCKQSCRFFQLMSQNFKAKWIYQAQKYNQRLNKDIQFYTSVSAMKR